MGKGGWEGDARGKGYGDTCIHIADALCYTAETNTPLEGNYTPIKMLKKKKRIILLQCDSRGKAALAQGLGGLWFSVEDAFRKSQNYG